MTNSIILFGGIITLPKLNQLKTILFFLIIAYSSIVLAQSKNKGVISGRVVDKSNGEVIIGANILLEGTKSGATSDIEGKYLITGIEPGKYNLIASYISYSKTKIPNIDVEAGKTTTINFALIPEAISFDEVVVISKADNSFEAALLNQQKTSSAISDGISAEQIKKSPDATSSDALKRVASVSIVDNKYVFVRGTSERYSNALLNNAPLASTEPDKKSFAFDLLPGNLLDNIIIEKSFMPDKPGDFSGGLIKVNTIDFPDRLKLNISFTGSFTNNTSLQDFKSYKGGSTDFLGIDDGTRNLPNSIPSDLNKANYSTKEILGFAKSLSNNWSPKSIKAPLNSGFMISLGDGTTLIGQNFGFVAALSYKNNYTTTKLERNEYEADSQPRFSFKGDQSTYSTLWGGLFNLNYKFLDYHKISFKNTYSHTSDDEVSELKGAQFSDSGKEQIQTALRFTSRRVYSGQLIGEHVFPSLNGLKAEWRGYTSISNRDEPDYRRIIYGRDIGTDNPFAAVLGFQVNLKNGGRFYSDLNEDTRGFASDFTLPLPGFKLKAGGVYDVKNREFKSRLIGMVVNAPGNGFTENSLYYLPIDKIFVPENFRQNGFSIQEYFNGTNNYNAIQSLSAAYLMFELPVMIFNNELRIVGGVRHENSIQKINSRDLSDQKDILIELKKADILPSLNLIYKINDKTNIRFALSQTVNRPELRELAPFAYFDFYTQTSIRGNENLQRALIQNYDFRLETFPGIGEMISGSFFYKSLSNAIEQVVVTGSALGSERTFRNADEAKIYGVELEGRLSLRHLGGYLSNFDISGNYSWIKSNVNVKGSETTISRNNRPLQGQSPYVINIGLVFNEPVLGTSYSLLYNTIGERIVEVATAYQEDVIEEPRHMIDFVITQPVFEKFEVKMTVKDLLGEDQIFRQGDKKARLNSRYASISFGVSYKL